MSVRRRVAVACSVAALSLSGFSAALASDHDRGRPGPEDNRGQERASANCEATIERQFQKGVTADEGPKAAAFSQPTNCDQFYQTGIDENIPGGVIGHGYPH